MTTIPMERPIPWHMIEAGMWSEGPPLYDRARDDSKMIPFELVGQELSVMDFCTRYYDSSYGQHQRTQPLRFVTHFGYNNDHMRDDLGPDVDPLDHNVLTLRFARNVAGMQSMREKVDEVEEAIAELAAGTHEMGEGTHPELLKKVGAVIGDIPFGEKTDQQRRIEAAIRGVHYDELWPDMPVWSLERIEGVISHSEDSPAHDYAELGHTIVAYKTGLAAGRVAIYSLIEKEETGWSVRTDEEIARLSSLAVAVTRTRRGHLEEFANKGLVAAETNLEHTATAANRILANLS